ncbi:MAG: M67 family metallopeptidase [Acidobacteria bacterium]|nr:M67 family metallopeptidase [Acidobacteriota bacterium]
MLRLNQDLSNKIRAHGAETYPHECCGALLGRDLDATTARSSDGDGLASREVTALFPLVNRRDDSPRNRFSVTSEDVRDAEKAAREKGIDVVGWYHSHPDHPAAPSQYDRDHAWPWYSYIIVSVANGRAENMTSWRLTDDRTQFTPENLEIAGRSGAAQSAT